jgi:20S proteasome alpha/beta subunit
MTVLVGVRCSDGVVIGTDSSATSAYGRNHLMRMRTDKIRIVCNRVILAGTGQVGFGQRFESILEEQTAKKLFQTADIVKACSILAREASNEFQQSGGISRQDGIEYGALVAAPSQGAGHLVEFAVGNFQPELKRDKIFFGSMGSGQNLAEPFLAFIAKVLWRNEPPTVQEAVFGVTWALQHCIDFAHGLVGPPIKLAVLEKDGSDWRARELEDGVRDEQQQHIKAIEERIASYPASILAEASASTPPEPPPP